MLLNNEIDSVEVSVRRQIWIYINSCIMIILSYTRKEINSKLILNEQSEN